MVKYIVITPVRDEEKRISKTIQSMACQTILPVQWIIVDDGSKDDTGKIIDSYAEKYSWITVIHRKDRGYRKNGGGVVEAFNEGYQLISDDGYDYLVKLDGDLLFEKDYFERCFKCFMDNPKLGIGGGLVVCRINDKTIVDKNPRFHVRGATKIYRKKCWDNLKCLVVAPGWDTLDEVKANLNGWHTETFNNIHIVQLKQTGEADGVWKNLVKNGRANYISGYHPLFMLLKSFRRITQYPWIGATLAYLWGFFSGYIMRIPRVNEPELISYLRKEQLKKILLKKSIWN